MGRNPRILLCGLLCCLLAAPAPARERDEPKAVPNWIPITLAGAVLVGGVLYLRHRHVEARREPMSPQERARDYIGPIATDDELEELSAIQGETEIDSFLAGFFAKRDPTPETPANEYREAYAARYLEASRLYGDARQQWKSDRRRIYLRYGEPAGIHRFSVRYAPDSRRAWSSVEIWEYAAAPGSNPFPRLLRDAATFDLIFQAALPALGGRLFLFINDEGEGYYRLGFSTEARESFDRSIYEIGGR